MTQFPASSNKLVYLHNDIIRQPLRMGKLETRIFLAALSQIKQGPRGHTVLPAFSIPVPVICGDDDSQKAYLAINKACNDLQAKDLTLPAPNTDGVIKTPVMSDILHVAGSNRIEGTFAPQMAPFLLQLSHAGNFTSAETEILLSFKNPHAQRLYWILKSWAGKSSKTPYISEQVKLDDLKMWLLADQSIYPTFAEFKRNVLSVIAADFKRVGYDASWTLIKSGRKVAGLSFKIPRANAQKQNPNATAPIIAGNTGKFESYLAHQDPKLQNAYKAMITVDLVSPAVGQRIVKFVVGNSTRENFLYKIRYYIQVNHNEILKKGYTRAAYLVNQLKSIGFS